MIKLQRTDRSDVVFSGVAGGLAKYFSVDSTLIRLFWIAFMLTSAGTAFIIYAIMALVIPSEQ